MVNHSVSYYSDVMMRAMASQITGVPGVYSSVSPGADQREHQSFESLAFVRSPVDFTNKGSVTRKMFTFDGVIMKENIKAPRHWLLWGESTGGWWIPMKTFPFDDFIMLNYLANDITRQILRFQYLVVRDVDCFRLWHDLLFDGVVNSETVEWI